MLIERPTWALIEFFDLKGYRHCLLFSGMLGRISLHEMDHLEGILISDKTKAKVKYSELESEESFMNFIKENAKYLYLLDI